MQPTATISQSSYFVGDVILLQAAYAQVVLDPFTAHDLPKLSFNDVQSAAVPTV